MPYTDDTRELAAIARAHGFAPRIPPRGHGHHRRQLRRRRDRHDLPRDQRGQRPDGHDAAARARRADGHREAGRDDGRARQLPQGAGAIRDGTEDHGVHDARPRAARPPRTPTVPRSCTSSCSTTAAAACSPETPPRSSACIRCGACLNACPVYRTIGGHAYGDTYPGPVGAIVTPGLRGLHPWSELAHASSLCGACREVCPVRLDIPRMLLVAAQPGGRRPATS